jgi:siroheme synthase
MTGPPLVSIVGAGPGDPDLLTVRAVRRLEAADVVFHDGLVPREIVMLATGAEHCLVSRRRGLPADPLRQRAFHARLRRSAVALAEAEAARTASGQQRRGAVRVAPPDVVALMVESARRGQRVVRLRAGDPFVLARGAEEALGLVAAGVPFEIVPGLTTASAAPTLAGIPLTHRGVVSGFVVVSGHAPDGYAEVLSALPPASVTVVALMGLTERRRISALLLARGWNPATPVAIVTNASQRSQRIWRGDLQSLGADVSNVSTETPGVIVIGEVVGVGAALAQAMRWPARLVPRIARERRGAGTVVDLQEVVWQP